MKKCPKCGAELPEDANICSVCWASIPEEKAKPLVNKSEMDARAKELLAKLSVPLLIQLDTYIRLTNEERKLVKQLKALVRDLEHYFGEASAHPEIYMALGNIALSARSYESAMEHMSSAIKADPKRKESWHNKGIAWYRRREFEEAVKCFNEALRIDSSFDSSLYAKAMALVYLGKLHEGMECYVKAIRINPQLKKVEWVK